MFVKKFPPMYSATNLCSKWQAKQEAGNTESRSHPHLAGVSQPEFIDDRRHQAVHHHEVWVDGQQEQHEKDEDRPRPRHLQFRHSLREDHIRQRETYGTRGGSVQFHYSF